MYNFLKSSIFFIFIFSLTGCGDHNSEQYYIKHPEALRNTIVICQSIVWHNGASYKCKRTIKIYNHLVTLSQKLMQNPQAFGREIISFETESGILSDEIIRLHKKIDQNSKQITQDVSKKINYLMVKQRKLLNEINTRRSLLAQAGRP